MSDALPTPTKPKSVLLSKTFWLQVIAILTALLPQVQAWLASNPVEVIAVFAAANVLVRFVTSGKVSIFPPEDKSGGASGGMMPLVVGLGLSMAAVGTLPSCAPGLEYPVTGTLAYTDPQTGAQVGLAVGSPQPVKKAKRTKITVIPGK